MPCNIIISDKWLREFEKFLLKLDKPTQAKVVRKIDLLEKQGPVLPMPYAKKLEVDIWELRVRGKQEVRILYSIVKVNVYVLCFFVKKSNETPNRELKLARARLQEI